MRRPEAIVVFTARSPARIIREGGSQAWTLNAARARQASWLICTQNQHNPNHEFSDATEPHGAAFLVGKISGVSPTQEDDSEGRWIIEISEYASVNVPDTWKHWRNPVRYLLIEDLGIDVDKLDFKKIPAKVIEAGDAVPHSTPLAAPKGMTIMEAKKALSITFGVDPDAVEILIRG